MSRTIRVGDKGLRTAYMRWPSNPETDFIIVERQRRNNGAAAGSDRRS